MNRRYNPKPVRHERLTMRARRCSREPVAATPDPDLIRVTPMAEPAGCSCSSCCGACDRNARPHQWRDVPRRAKPPGAAVNTKGRNNPAESDPKFFDLCPYNRCVSAAAAHDGTGRRRLQTLVGQLTSPDLIQVLSQDPLQVRQPLEIGPFLIPIEALADLAHEVDAKDRRVEENNAAFL
jgi:hypothetical protein